MRSEEQTAALKDDLRSLIGRNDLDEKETSILCRREMAIYQTCTASAAEFGSDSWT